MPFENLLAKYGVKHKAKKCLEKGVPLRLKNSSCMIKSYVYGQIEIKMDELK